MHRVCELTHAKKKHGARTWTNIDEGVQPDRIRPHSGLRVKRRGAPWTCGLLNERREVSE